MVQGLAPAQIRPLPAKQAAAAARDTQGSPGENVGKRGRMGTKLQAVLEGGRRKRRKRRTPSSAACRLLQWEAGGRPAGPRPPGSSSQVPSLQPHRRRQRIGHGGRRLRSAPRDSAGKPPGRGGRHSSFSMQKGQNPLARQPCLRRSGHRPENMARSSRGGQVSGTLFGMGCPVVPPWEPGTRMLESEQRRQTLVLPQAEKKHGDLEARTYKTPGEVFHFCLDHHGPTLSCNFSSFVSWGAWEMERMKRNKTEKKERKNISDRSQTTFSRLLREV